MHIRQLTAEDAGTLSEFLKAHPHGALEQSWEWGELQTTISGRPDFVILGLFESMKEKELIGSMLMIRQVMGRGKTWLWCPNGPVLPLEEKGLRAWNLLRHEAGKMAHRNHDVFIRMEPSVNADSPLIAKAKKVKTSYLPRHTLMIDLSLKESEILEEMKQKGRYNIRQSEKANVKVREGKAKDMIAFYKILKETGERDGFHHHKQEFYEQFLSLLEGNAVFYVAEVKKEIVGGMLVSFFGDRATYYFGASGNQHRKTMAPYALQWHAIREAKKRKCKWYDFLGIAPEGDKKHPLKGVTQFKTRFGGKRVDYHRSQVIVMRRLWWWAYSIRKCF